MDKLTSMQVFCRVVTRENFSQAARDLRLSPAMITRHISSLEQELGIRLLNRTTRRVSTTEAGARYYQHCVNLLSDIEEAEASLYEMGSKPQGLLKLTCPLDFGTLCLAPAIAIYLNRYPEVQIDINYQDRKVSLIEEGFDMAIRIGHLEDSSLVAQRIMPCPVYCCASPGYLQSHPPLTSPEQLKDHNCLTYAYSSSNNEWQFSSPRQNHRIKVSGRLNSNNGRASVAAALLGVGVILKPEFMVREYLESGELVALFPDYRLSETNVYAVCPHRQFMPAKITTFIAFLKEYFATG